MSCNWWLRSPNNNNSNNARNVNNDGNNNNYNVNNTNNGVVPDLFLILCLLQKKLRVLAGKYLQSVLETKESFPSPYIRGKISRRTL